MSFEKKILIIRQTFSKVSKSLFLIKNTKSCKPFRNHGRKKHKLFNLIQKSEKQQFIKITLTRFSKIISLLFSLFIMDTQFSKLFKSLILLTSIL